MFFGREDVFTWIENSLSGKFVDHILVLHGQRRVGKTSVLKQIPNFLTSQYVQVFFDLQGRTNTTLERFLWWMASEIVRTLKKEHDIDLPRPKRDAFADPDAFIADFIPALQAVMGDKVLLLTFDEFDSLDRSDIQESLARPLISFLRRLFEVEGFNFIFSIGSSGNKLENMQATYTDFFKTALYRKVSFLTRDECYNLITRPVAGVITYEPEAIEQIIAITSGHPYFTQLTCHELFARCQKTGSRVVTAADVAEILDDVIERGTVNLKFVWDEASDLEKWILAALGQGEGLSLKGISQLLKSQGVRFVESDLNSAVLHLRDKDVLTRENAFVIQLMKHWLETNRPMDRVREELVQTNPIADRYIEIGDEYRDRQQFKQALDSYQQALDVQPNSLGALYNVASIHLQMGDNQLAAEVFLKALQVDDEHIAARQGYCQAQLAVGDSAQREGLPTTAIEAYQAILNVNPAHAAARQKLADIYRGQAETQLAGGLDQKALDSLRLALEMTPEDESLEARCQVIIAERKAALVADWLDKAGKALRRKRWDEAAQLAEEALKVDPDDQAVQRRLAQIKDAPRLERLNAYKAEAEAAMARGQYPKAISALELAVLLAPEDNALAEMLQMARGDQQHAQLRMIQAQAAQAEAAGDWAGVVAAREAALKLNPNEEHLAQALADAKTAFRQARISALRGQVDSARQAERWDEAVGALQDLLALAPTDQAVQAELEHLLAAQQKARLAALLTQAEEAAQQEHWDQALANWEAYLVEVPGDAEKLESRMVKARKYAQLSADYQAAQDFMRKRQYNRAISKLQGIFTLEPTYKATSRLLVEAVEASKQHKPFWRQPLVYGGLAGVIMLSLGLIFNQRITAFFSSQSTPIQVGEMDTLKSGEVVPPVAQTITETAIVTVEAIIQQDLTIEPTPTTFIPTATLRLSQTPTPVPAWVTDFAEPILAYIADRPADIEDNSPREIENSVYVVQGVSDFDYVISAQVNEIYNGAGFELDNGNGNYVFVSVNPDPGFRDLSGVEPTRWLLGKEDSLLYYGFDQGFKNSYKIMIIFKGPLVMFYLDNKPQASYEYENHVINRGSRPIIRLAAQTGKATFSNVKIWDITNLDLP